MALRVCLPCSTLYAVGLKACPQCGAPTRDALYSWECDVVKANEHGSSYYVAEGAEVPSELDPAVRLVGPGAPKPPKAKAEPKTEDKPAPKAEEPKPAPKAKDPK